MRVVLDTNVLISALLFRGSLDRIARLIGNDQITLCFTESTLEELTDVLCREKFSKRFEQLGLLDPDEIVRALLNHGELFEEQPVPSDVRDPEDAKFLACACTARADAIVSGDAHLRGLLEFRGIPILSPAQFLRKIARTKFPGNHH